MKPESSEGFQILQGGTMKQPAKRNPGIKKLTQKYRTIFRVPENLNHYAEKDFHAAERKFLKYALEDGIYLINKKPVSRPYANAAKVGGFQGRG